MIDKMKILYFTIIILVLNFLLNACSEDKTTNDDNEFLIQNSEKIFITDRTGKRLDVTRAQIKYGMRERIHFM